MKPRLPLESNVVQSIRYALGLRRDVFLERRPAGLVSVKGGKTVRLTLTGTPDLTGHVRVLGVCVWLGMEVKVPGRLDCRCDPAADVDPFLLSDCKGLDEGQRVYHLAQLERGAVCFVVHSAEEAVLLLARATETMRRVIMRGADGE